MKVVSMRPTRSCEQSAKGAAEMARNTPSPDFVKFDRIDVQEIIAST